MRDVNCTRREDKATSSDKIDKSHRIRFLRVHHSEYSGEHSMSAFTPIEPYIAEPMARSNHGLQPADCYFQVALSDSKVALSQVMDRLLSLALASIGYFQVALSVCVVTVLSQVIIALPRSRSARESRLFPGGAVEFGGRRIPGHRGAPCCDCLDAVWLLPGRVVTSRSRCRIRSSCCPRSSSCSNLRSVEDRVLGSVRITSRSRCRTSSCFLSSAQRTTGSVTVTSRSRYRIR